MSELAIEIRGLSKIYRTGFWMRPISALKTLDLDVHRGEPRAQPWRRRRVYVRCSTVRALLAEA